MPSLIRIGCRVTGLVGPLQPVIPGDVRKKRKRERFVGTVIGSCPDKNWMVRWDNIGKVAIHHGAKLAFLSPAPENALEGIDLEAARAGTDFVGSQKGIDEYLKTWTPVTNPSTISTNNTTATNTTMTTDTNDNSNVEAIVETVFVEEQTAGNNDNNNNNNNNTDESIITTDDPIATESVIVENSTEEAVDPDTQEIETELFDDNELAAELAEDHRTGRHFQQWTTYMEEKAALVGNIVEVKYGRNGSSMNSWKVIEDVKEEDIQIDEEFDKVGISNFNFNQLEKRWTKNRKRIDFLKLLQHLWPGDYKKQIRELNKKIQQDNNRNQQNIRHGRAKKYKLISEREFWKFWGLILMARIYGRKGNDIVSIVIYDC